MLAELTLKREAGLSLAPEITLQRDKGEDAQDEPLAETRTGEEISNAETSEVLTAFRARAKAENDRRTDATDSEFWIAVCFQTREQKEEFLKKMQWLALGDKYIDGQQAAKVSGITLESVIPPTRKVRHGSSWDELTLERGEI